MVFFIFRFRMGQDRKAPGLSSTAKALRKKRNLVSVRFNMINWVVESVSLILVMFGENLLFKILYLLVNSCSTPLVYYLGIEENRQMARDYFQSRMRIFRKNRLTPDNIKQ